MIAGQSPQKLPPERRRLTPTRASECCCGACEDGGLHLCAVDTGGLACLRQDVCIYREIKAPLSLTVSKRLLRGQTEADSILAPDPNPGIAIPRILSKPCLGSFCDRSAMVGLKASGCAITDRLQGIQDQPSMERMAANANVNPGRTTQFSTSDYGLGPFPAGGRWATRA